MYNVCLVLTMLVVIGAGDTFIAGALFGLICRSFDLDDRRMYMKRASCWSLQQLLEFSNGLAGRKVLQNGFGGLSAQVKDLKSTLDSSSYSAT